MLENAQLLCDVLYVVVADLVNYQRLVIVEEIPPLLTKELVHQFQNFWREIRPTVFSQILKKCVCNQGRNWYNNSNFLATNIGLPLNIIEVCVVY